MVYRHRRIIWLIFFGLVHSYLLLWHGEVLYAYGMMGLIVFSFRKMAPRKLVLIALFLIACGTVWNYAEYRVAVKFTDRVTTAAEFRKAGKPLTTDLADAEKQWQDRLEKRSPAAVQEANSNMRKGYFSLVAFLAPLNMKMGSTFFYRHILWNYLV